MQNKGSTYLLIAAFIVIWFIAGYKIYKALHRDDTAQEPTFRPISDKLSQKIDSFELSLQYNDPFRLNSERHNVVSNYVPVPVKKKEPDPVKPAQPAYKPSGIIFKGLINNNTGKRQVAIISFQGKDLLFWENETIDMLTLVKIYDQDSIFVNYDSHPVVIKR